MCVCVCVQIELMCNYIFVIWFKKSCPILQMANARKHLRSSAGHLHCQFPVLTLAPVQGLPRKTSWSAAARMGAGGEHFKNKC